MYQHDHNKRRRCTSNSSSGGGGGAGVALDTMSDIDDSPMPCERVDENPEHGMRLLRGLSFLKKEKVLCDVTLIAEGKTNKIYSTFMYYCKL